MTTGHALVLRLAAPLQSWGGQSDFNRRETQPVPTKSGVVGLLAAAQGRRREDPIEDLLGLVFGVRTDQPGSLMRDYHTVSDYRGVPLRSASVNTKGLQKSTTPAKYTHVTQRFYLQDAVFVAAVGGPVEFLRQLAEAVLSPVFPLALGRRSCVPTQPLVIRDDHGGPVWEGDPLTVLRKVEWQAGSEHVGALARRGAMPSEIQLPVVVDDPEGADVRGDVPVTFDPKNRSFTTRRVGHHWVSVATGASGGDVDHDPFALLGW